MGSFAEGLPNRFPVGTRYVVEGHGGAQGTLPPHLRYPHFTGRRQGTPRRPARSGGPAQTIRHNQRHNCAPRSNCALARSRSLRAMSTNEISAGLTIAGFCDRFSLSRSTVYKLIRAGDLTVVYPTP